MRRAFLDVRASGFSYKHNAQRGFFVCIPRDRFSAYRYRSFCGLLFSFCARERIVLSIREGSLYMKGLTHPRTGTAHKTPQPS